MVTGVKNAIEFSFLYKFKIKQKTFSDGILCCILSLFPSFPLIFLHWIRQMCGMIFRFVYAHWFKIVLTLALTILATKAPFSSWLNPPCVFSILWISFWTNLTSRSKPKDNKTQKIYIQWSASRVNRMRISSIPFIGWSQCVLFV